MRQFATLNAAKLCGFGLFVALSAGACTASIGADGAGTGGGLGSSPGGPNLMQGSAGAPSVRLAADGALPVMRRLTAREYNNTVEDLLGDTTHPADAFDPDGTAAGFDNQVALLSVNISRARQYWTAAGQLAEAAKIEGLFPCDAAQRGDDVCASEFARNVGKRAFRRPLVPEELTILLGVYGVAKQGDGHQAGLRQMLKAMLVMPPFLYRLDVTPGASGVAGTAPADPYQVASRLSYALLQSMPDAELFAAADAGGLRTAEQVAVQTARLMGLPRAQAMSQDFYSRWLGLGGLGAVAKNAATFPKFNDGLRAALVQEANEFLKHTLWNEAGSLHSFFAADYSFRNQLLSEHYGDSAVTGAALTLTKLNPERSAGILTLGGLMSLLSTPEHTDPVQRGKFIRERVLCQTVPPPPPGVVAAFPPFDAQATTRQRFATHQNDPACASCHRMMDGLGLGFESLDAVGVYRSDEQGLPIDASGEIVNTDVDGPFVGPRALAEKLAVSQQAQSCVASTWFRFIAGREAVDGDVSTLSALQTALASSGQKALLTAATQTAAFLTRYQGDLP